MLENHDAYIRLMREAFEHWNTEHPHALEEALAAALASEDKIEI
jgi:hypothetical protein